MTAKKLTIAAMLAGTTLAATTASLAQVHTGGTYAHGSYAPAPGAGPFNSGGSLNDTKRGLTFVDCLESGAAESCGNGSYRR